ncbi:MAG: cobalamin-dependent protein [Pseudomonadota bacterium]
MTEKRNNIQQDASQLPPSIASVDWARYPDAPSEVAARLRESVVHSNRSRFESSVEALLEDGVRIVDLIDVHIPTVARWLGAEWCSNGMSFAEVSIGCARLQGLVRDLDSRIALKRPWPDGPSVLLVIPPDTYHTLGAMVTLSRLRRLGVSVRLLIIRDVVELVELVREQRFDMIAISASGAERLEMLRMLVKNARTGSVPPPPVVVGGSVLEQEPNIAILIGADHSSGDPEEALRLCGLKIPTIDAELSEAGL